MKDYRHGPEADVYWTTLNDLQHKGTLGWKIVDRAIDPEIEAEKTVQLAGEGADLKKKHREDPLFVQVISCLEKLERLEQKCDQVSKAASKNSEFVEMMHAANERDALAQDILKDLEEGRSGQPPLLQALRDDLQMLKKRKEEIVERWRDVYDTGDGDGGQGDITMRDIKRGEEIRRADVDRILEIFRHERFGFCRPSSSGSRSVLGPDIQVEQPLSLSLSLCFAVSL